MATKEKTCLTMASKIRGLLRGSKQLHGWVGGNSIAIPRPSDNRIFTRRCFVDAEGAMPARTAPFVTSRIRCEKICHAGNVSGGLRSIAGRPPNLIPSHVFTISTYSRRLPNYRYKRLLQRFSACNGKYGLSMALTPILNISWKASADCASRDLTCR